MNTTSPRVIETLQIEQLDWPRIMSAIARSGHTYPDVDWDKLKLVEFQLRRLLEIVGFWSISRKALTNIGETLFQAPPDGVKIISPVCFDHDQVEMEATATFPKLVQAHVMFIEMIKTVIPVTSVTFLFASYGKTQSDKTKQRMKETADLVQASFIDPFYSAMTMGRYLPNIRSQEERVKAEVSASSGYFQSLIEKLSSERMADGMRRGVEKRLWRRRTIKSIGEFIALGRHAATSGILICFHTTGRIKCFHKAGAGVLHNPVGFR